MTRSMDVKIELFKWSSEDFPQERALIYTSHSNASRTCSSRFSWNRQKFIFSLQDYMCENNPVRVYMELMVEQDGNNNNGNFKFGSDKRDFTGIFSESRHEHRKTHLNYQDIQGSSGRKVQFHAYRTVGKEDKKKDEWTISHSLINHEVKSLWYYLKVVCDPKNGLHQPQLLGPLCFKDSSLQQIGRCYINREVFGKPQNVSNIKEHEKDMVVSNRKQGGGPLTVSAQANTLRNEGWVQGYLNGSVITISNSQIIFSEGTVQWKKSTV